MIPPICPNGPESDAFDYACLDLATRRLVERRTDEIKGLVRQTAKGVINIGLKLLEVKEELGHGKFGKWLKSEFGWGTTTAWKMMRVAEAFKFSHYENLNIAASALYLLAEPSTPEEARKEALERAAQGETITHIAAKQIIAHHTIDVEAETVAEDDQPPASIQPTPEPLSPSPRNPEQAGEELHPPAKPYQAGGRIRILRRQDGQDKWRGKAARIREITPDGRLRVDVEGHKGVRFTLNPEWVEPMSETPESYKAQPGQAPLPTAEPGPESSAIAGASSGEPPANPPPLQLQAGDRLRLANLEQSGQQWVGEVADVIEVAEDRVQVVIEIPRPNP